MFNLICKMEEYCNVIYNNDNNNKKSKNVSFDERCCNEIKNKLKKKFDNCIQKIIENI